MADTADPTELARRAALLLLARREFASFELQAKLLAKGHSPEVIDSALAALKAERLLDDARFLDNYLRVHAGRGQGPARIRQDLRQIGFGSEAIEAVLADGPDFLALCREVRVRKFGARPPASWAEKGKQARFLQYRGFSSDHIRLAMGQDPDTTENPADDHD
ncbi:MAG: recombination regulator RecX [Gammaproteobacteria bacterium]|nr:recombination regulator RecX [Gammaproteobacteria bacterium]